MCNLFDTNMATVQYAYLIINNINKYIALQLIQYSDIIHNFKRIFWTTYDD